MDSYDDLDDDYRTRIYYSYALTVCYALSFLALIVLAFCSLCCASRGRDPARSWINWLKASMFICSLCFLFSSIVYVIEVVVYNVTLSAYSSILYDLSDAASYLSVISALLFFLAQVHIFITLSKLAQGISLACNTETPKSSKIATSVTFATAALLVLMPLVSFGLNLDIALKASQRNKNRSSSSSSADYYLNTFRVVLAAYVLFFLASLAITAWSIKVAVTAKKHPQVSKTGPVYLIVCCVLFFLSCTYSLANFAYHVDTTNLIIRSYRNYDSILGLVFGDWTLFVLLIILFALAVKRYGGVSSTAQPGQYQPDVPAPQPGYYYGPGQPHVTSDYHQQAQFQQRQYQHPQYQQTQVQAPYGEQQQQPHYQQQPMTQQGYPPPVQHQTSLSASSSPPVAGGQMYVPESPQVSQLHTTPSPQPAHAATESQAPIHYELPPHSDNNTTTTAAPAPHPTTQPHTT